MIKVEGVRRPDGMWFSEGRPPDWDQWWEWGPVFLCSNNNKRGVSVDLGTDAGRSVALELIAASDLLIENFSPRVMANFGLEWDAVRAANPHAIMVRMPAFGLDGPWRDRVGFAQTMEQATGMAWMTGHADGPPVIPRGCATRSPACTPPSPPWPHWRSATARVPACRSNRPWSRRRSTWPPKCWSSTRATESPCGAMGTAAPAHPQGVYRCRGDDEWVALAALDTAARASLAGLLDQPDLHDTAWDERADDIDKLICAWAATRSVTEAVDALRAAGVAAARVTPPRRC